MGYVINSAIIGLALVGYMLHQRQRQRADAVRSHGCEPPAQHRSFELFFGFDLEMKMYSHIPLLYDLHTRYGNTFQSRSWVSLPTICTIDLDNIRAINTSKQFGVEPMRLPGMGYFCGKGFITTDGATWSDSRKLLKPSFDSKNIGDLTVLKGETDSLISQLPKDGSTVDLQPLLYVMFLHSALHFVLGARSSDQLSDAPLNGDEFVKSFHKALLYSMFRVILGPAWKLVPQGGYKSTCAEAHGFIDYYIKHALAEKDSLRNKSLMKALSAQTDDLDFIRSQAIQSLMAAQDTTSELLTNALFLLARNSDEWTKLRGEFDGKSDEDLTAESVRTSKVTENILLETLRLYPIFALSGRVALDDTTLPSGGGPNQDKSIFVPKGSTVVMGYYGLHRNANVFGADVESFRPDRWDLVKPGQWEFLGFGGGNRACLGQQKAMVEASYVLARLSQTLESLEPRDGRPWKGELKLTCKSAHGCKIAVRYS